jgi:hypothetical protein
MLTDAEKRAIGERATYWKPDKYGIVREDGTMSL